MSLLPLFTRDDFAQVLVESLPPLRFTPDLRHEYALLLGDKRICWKYPAVVKCERDGAHVLIVPRFGNEYSPIPPYVFTYLDAVRNQTAALSVFIAVPDYLADSYGAVATDLGFGLLGVDIGAAATSVLLEPGIPQLARLKEKEQRVVDLATESRRRRIEDIERDERSFLRTATRREIDNPTQYSNYFEEERTLCARAFDQRTTAAQRAVAKRDEAALDALIRDLEEGRDPL